MSVNQKWLTLSRKKVTSMNGPKVGKKAALVKLGYMLETLCISQYSLSKNL